MKTVYADHALKNTCVYKWMERFRDGREAVEDDEGRGRPTTSKNVENVDSVRSLVEEDGRLSVCEITQAVDISVGSVQSILPEDLGLSKISARWVPKALHPDQLNLRCEVSTSILTKIEANEDAVAVGWSLIASGQRLLLPEKHSRYTYIKVLSPPRPVVAELISLFTAKCLEKYPKELLLFKMT